MIGTLTRPQPRLQPTSDEDASQMTSLPKPPAANSFAKFERRIPDGDAMSRLVCADCGHIHYDNPKIVTGAVIAHEGKVLLARRAIHPRKGFWTIPAGYLEENETVEAGAARECMEEAGARIAIEGLLAVYSIPRISQVQMIYRARLEGGAFSAGPESLEVALFAWDEIPWREIAFPSVHWTLNYWRESAGKPLGQPFVNPPGETGDPAAR